MNNTSWKDKDYLDQIERFAKLLSKSKAIHITFRNDVETCFMLCLMADGWSIHPHIVAANSFYDNFGRLSHTGKLLKLILNESPLVEKVDVSYEGDWAAVSNKFKMVDNIAVPSWEPSIEATLSCTITVKLTNGETHIERTTLGDLDLNFRSLNQAWAMRTYNQIYNHTLRQITNGKLSHIILDMDSTEAFEEQTAAEKLASDNSIVIRASKEESSMDDNVSPEIDQNVEVETDTVISTPINSDAFILLQKEQVVLLSAIDSNDVQQSDVQAQIAQWVGSVQKEQDALSSSEQMELSNLYDSLVKKFKAQAIAA